MQNHMETLWELYGTSSALLGASRGLRGTSWDPHRILWDLNGTKLKLN